MRNNTAPKVEAFLDHHGVKGQKWGIRNKEKSSNSTPKMNRKDKHWKKNITTLHGAIQVHNAMADRMNNGLLEGLNNRHNLSESDWDADYNPITKASQKYMDDYNSMVVRESLAAFKRVHGTSPTGNYEASLDDNGLVVIKPKSVRHADDVLPMLVFKPIRDKNGQIIAMRPAPMPTPVHHSSIEQAFLDHHGVKGQKWGIRNKRSSNKKRRSSSETIRKRAKQMNSEDLQTHIKRMELEKKYIDLSKQTGSSGKKYASELLQNNGKTIVGSVLGTATAFAVKRALKNKFGE